MMLTKIKLIGEWNLSQRTMSYWGEGQTKLIVKKSE
jgi:hypothetical protein